MPEPFGIRSALQGVLHDFAESSGFLCVQTENLIRDIVSLLASYREEDTPLFPHVYILNDPVTLRSLAPGAASHTIGTLAYGPDTAAKILKNTAGLAGSGWAVYAGKLDDGRFEFGIFRSQRHSYATSAEESMMGDDASIIVIRNQGHLTVELVNSKGDPFTVSLTAAQPAESKFAKNVLSLVSDASSALNSTDRGSFVSYGVRQFSDVLQRCHGTLIAVVDASVEEPPAELSDGVWLSPSVALGEYHRKASHSNEADSLADLQAAESLFAGMVHSDGIVVFDTKANLRAFRVFLAPTADERERLDDKGGGRRRTFDLMSQRVEQGALIAAFIRSQDGETDYSGVLHG